MYEMKSVFDEKNPKILFSWLEKSSMRGQIYDRILSRTLSNRCDEEFASVFNNEVATQDTKNCYEGLNEVINTLFFPWLRFQI